MKMFCTRVIIIISFFGFVLVTGLNKRVNRCPIGELMCGDFSGCVKSKHLCDLNNDCQDGTDETETICKQMKSTQNICDNGDFYCKIHDNYYSNDDKVYCKNLVSICVEGTDICEYLDGNITSLCETIKFGQLPPEKVEESNKFNFNFDEVLNFVEAIVRKTPPNERNTCPSPYEPFQEKCVLPYFLMKTTWNNALSFCESMHGELATFKDILEYKNMLDWLEDKNVTRNGFWIGGQKAENLTSKLTSWEWLDRNQVEMGAPFWAIENWNGHETLLEPSENQHEENCLAMLSKNYFYFSSEKCSDEYIPLCMKKLD